jgi:hypothetical protein
MGKGAIMITAKMIMEDYLDYFNNYLTIAKYAQDRGLTLEEGQDLVLLGKALHEKQFVKDHFQFIKVG